MPSDLLQRAHDQAQRLAALDQALVRDAQSADQARTAWDPSTPVHQVATAWRASLDHRRQEVHQLLAEVQAQGTAIAAARAQGVGDGGTTTTPCPTCTPSTGVSWATWIVVAGAVGVGGWWLWRKYAKRPKPKAKENPTPLPAGEPAGVIPSGRPSPRFGHGDYVRETYHDVEGEVIAVEWSTTHQRWAYRLEGDPPMWIYEHPDHVVRARRPEGPDEDDEEGDEDEDEA